MEAKKSFLGTGWNFPPTFHREYDGPEMISDEADIKSSLDILFSTTVGERVMQPTYGCNLLPFVFEPMNVATKTTIEKIVSDGIKLNEPRIIVDKIQIDYSENEGMIQISIDYRIITTNTRYNYVFPFYYNEASNLVK